MRPLRPLKRRMSYEVVRRFPSSAALNPETQIGFVFKLAVAGDQRSLAVATQDRAIRLIDLERLAIVSQIAPAHDATITDIQAVPVSVAGNSTTFCSSSNDGTCKIWDLRQQAPVITVKVSNDSYDAPVFAASVSESGTCAVSCGSSISMFKFGDWKKFFEYTESHFDTVSCLSFSRHSGQADLLVSGSDDGMVNVYNTTDLVNEDDGQCPIMTLNTEDSVRQVFWSHATRMHVFSTTEALSVWEISTGARVCPNIDSIRSHPLVGSDETGWGYLVGMDASGERVLAGNSDGTLVEFSTATAQPINTFGKAHTGVIRSAVYLNSGKIVSDGEDGFLYEWAQATAANDLMSGNGHVRSQRVHSAARPY